MADRLKLTVDVIKKLVPLDKRYYVLDEMTKGLRIVILPRGGKVWYWVGRTKRGPQSIKLGEFPAVPIQRARDEATRINGDIADGRQPKSRAAAAKEELTLGQVHQWFMVNISTPHRSDPERDDRLFELNFEHWRHFGLSEIDTKAVTELHVKIGNTRGKVAANLALRKLGSLYKIAIKKLGYTGVHPVRGIDEFAVAERDRFLQPSELVKFFEKVTELTNPDARDLFLLCLFTGARKHNVAAMEWSEIDYDAKLWTIPASKFKTKKPMLAVLVDEAIAVLNDREKFRTKSKFVFPSRAKSGHFTWPKNSWRILKDMMGVQDIRIHDLRRTFASYQAGLNTSLHIIAKSLGHTSLESTKIYARLQLDPVREAVSQAVSAITGIGKSQDAVNRKNGSESPQSSSESPQSASE